MAPRDIDRILAVFCAWAAQWAPSQTRFLGLNALVQLVADGGVGQSFDALKATAWGALAIAAHPPLVRQVFNFLTTLASLERFQTKSFVR
jgi:hypothetical protein